MYSWLRRALEKALLLVNQSQAKRLIRRYQRANEAALARGMQPLKLQLGCGKNYLDGWLNLDSDPTLDRVDLRWDLSHSIPLPDASVQLIYSEHLLEHFPVEQGMYLMREAHRVLVPGGVVRIAMPSLEHLVEKYSSDDWRSQAWLSMPEFSFIQTRAEMLNVALRWWGHEWLYDREELRRRLLDAGFTTIHDVERGASSHAQLCNLESRDDSRLICEAVKSNTPAGE